MTKRTRFKIALGLITFLGSICIYSLIIEQYELTSETLAAIMVVAPAYIISDGYRKSE